MENEIGSKEGARSDGKFVVAGFLSLGFTVVLAITISASFDVPVFLSWVGLFWMACVPFQTVTALFWQFELPDRIAKLPQPRKGFAFLMLTAASGLGIGGALLAFPGGGISPPGPQLVMFVIFTISVALWWIVAFAGWPITVWIRSPLLAGLILTVAIYPLSYLLYQLLFDFSFLQGSPVARTGDDPRGLLNAWTALILGITSVAVLLMAVLTDFWFLQFVSRTERPWLKGATLGALIMPVSAVIFWAATEFFGISEIRFMLWGPVAFIFGFFIITSFFQNRLLAARPQPGRGIHLGLAAAAIGVAMVAIYWLSSSILIGDDLIAGPPNYDQELWVANALLAITFPLTVVIAGGFELWPFQRRDAQPAVTTGT